MNINELESLMNNEISKFQMKYSYKPTINDPKVTQDFSKGLGFDLTIQITNDLPRMDFVLSNDCDSKAELKFTLPRVQALLAPVWSASRKRKKVCDPDEDITQSAFFAADIGICVAAFRAGTVTEESAGYFCGDSRKGFPCR